VSQLIQVVEVANLCSAAAWRTAPAADSDNGGGQAGEGEEEEKEEEALPHRG